MSRKLLYSICCCLVLSVSTQAQDAGVFSQFFAAPMQLNPALTGGTYAPRFFLNYRNQWPSLNRAYITVAASYDQLVPSMNSAFGISILSDQAGDGLYNTTKINGAYAYTFKMNDIYVKGGLEVGVTQLKLNWNELVFLDMIDPVTGTVGASGIPNQTNEDMPFSFNKTYADFSAGMLVYNKTYYGGVSIKHLNGPSESFLNDFEATALPIRWTLHGGAQINMRRNHRKYLDGTFLSPNIMYVRQGQFQQLNAGTYLSLGKAFGGAWYRYSFGNPDAVILLVGMQYSIFKIGYSYDITVSELSVQSNGAHEVSISVNFDNNPNVRKRNKAKRYMDCFELYR
ncbi:MAG: PorP/SprF family type IX secretion system membrane protein [Saprospiraceae bacterium]